MNITCPACRAEMSLDVLLAAEDTRHVLADLLAVSLPFGALTLRYIALFRPPKRHLSHRRMLDLVAELLQDVRRGAIERKGRDWPLSVDLWRQGLETVLAARDKGQLTLPLTSHGYLYEVLCALADKHEGEQERQAEADRRARMPTAAPAEEPLQVVDALAPAPAPAPVPTRTGPSMYARKLRAEIDEMKKRRQGGAADQATDQPTGEGA